MYTFKQISPPPGVQRVALYMAFFAVLILIIAILHPRTFVRAEENFFDTIDPSAKRALQYGDRHFDAPNPQQYDLVRAEFFYHEALARDPMLPYVHHQLARIAFLKGDFGLAMAHINKELALSDTPSPASYYIRALIRGYLKDYVGAAEDYETYFKITPANWAGINDYSWVLLKADAPQLARSALEWGLKQWPDNPWLLTNYATALYELRRFEEAETAAIAAERAVARVTTNDWLMAYPGNDPLMAPAGLAAFKKAAADNVAHMHRAVLDHPLSK